MPGDSHYRSTGQDQWYQQPHPDEYSYNPGYGFFQKSPQVMEKLALKRYAAGLSAAVFSYMALSYVLPFFFASFFRLSFIANPLSGSSAAQSIYYIISSLVFVLALGLPFCLYAFIIRIPKEVACPITKRPDPAFVIPAICLGLGLSVIGRFFILLLAMVFPTIGLEPAVSDPILPDSPIAFIFCAIHLALLPALLEEFVLRGIVMQSLRRFGDGFALMVSSVLFMLLHQNIIQYPNALIMGFFIGYCVLYTGSIWVGIAIHFANNLSVLLLLIAEKYIGVSQTASLVCYGLFLVAALVGLAFLVRQHPRLFHIPRSRALNPTSTLFRVFYTTPGVWIAIVFMVGAALQSMKVVT